jgi:hypothetical protein
LLSFWKEFCRLSGAHPQTTAHPIEEFAHSLTAVLEPELELLFSDRFSPHLSSPQSISRVRLCAFVSMASSREIVPVKLHMSNVMSLGQSDVSCDQ